MKKFTNLVIELVVLSYCSSICIFSDEMQDVNILKNPFSEVSLRKKGEEMSLNQLHALQNQLLELVNENTSNPPDEHSLLYNSPVTLVSGLYKFDKKHIQYFLNSVNENLLESFRERNDHAFNKEDDNDQRFYRKFILYHNLLDQIIAISFDKNDIDFCLEIINSNLDTPFSAARLVLCKRLITYYNTDTIDSLIKKKMENIILIFIEKEKDALELSIDRNDFIRSFNNSKAILNVLRDRKDENKDITERY